jgi:hypothetical protein
MADYYSVISRAVAALEINTFEDRRTIYNRARAAQSYQLGKRRFNKADFDRERLMLEDAITRVEIEVTTKRIPTEASPSAPVQPSHIGPTPMMPLPSVRAWLKRVLYRLWRQVLLRRRRRAAAAEPSASPIKHPLISDFDIVVTKAALNVTFKPTKSTYIFHRRVDTNVTARLGPVSCVGVEHAGHDTEDYPRDEVQNMAQQIASEHVPAHFGQWPTD